MKQWGNWGPWDSKGRFSSAIAAVAPDGSYKYSLMHPDGSLITRTEDLPPGHVFMRRYRSKHEAGRELDGREWNETPTGEYVSTGGTPR